MTNARRIRLFLPLPVLAVAALVWPLSRPEASEPPRTADEVAYESLPEAPQGEIGVGRAGVEPSAIAHAAWLKAVPSAKGSEVPCAQENLFVSWDTPPSTTTHGRYIPPLGPAPSATTDAVNGIVQCKGSEDFAYMGFQARYAGGQWEIQAVPYVGDEDHLEEITTPEPEAPVTGAPVGPVTLDGRTFGAAIEGLSAYEPQRTCSASAKPGTAAMRNMLLRDNRGSRNLGIVRGCGIGGQSEHKEGRAFDWGVYVSNAAERAYAENFVAKLLATDEHGNRYALARRMGIMYVIWNRKIWSAYRASDGWRPYGGASPHTDHVHISLSWAGATAKTSFWSGNVVEVLLAAAPTGTESRSSSSGSSAKASRRRQTTLSTDQIAARNKRDEQRRAAAAAWEAERQRRREERKAEREAARKAWEEKEALDDAARDALRAEAKAKWEAEREERAARRKVEEEAKALARAEAKAKYEADKLARAEQYAIEKAARDAAKELARAEAKAKYEADKQAKAERYAAEKQARADKAAADKAARDEARRLAAEKYLAEKAARDQARRDRRRGTTTTVPAPTPTTAPAPEPTTTTTAAPEPETTTTTEAG